MGAAAAMAVLAIIAGVVGFIAYEKSIEAQMASQRALENLAEAQRAQSQLLAKASREATNTGDSTQGILLALEALPQDPDNPDRPQVLEAEMALYQALHDPRNRIELNFFKQPTGTVRVVGFSSLGNRLVTVAKDGTAQLWDFPSGEVIAGLGGEEGAITYADFSGDGKYLVTTSRAMSRLMLKK